MGMMSLLHKERRVEEDVSPDAEYHFRAVVKLARTESVPPRFPGVRTTYGDKPRMYRIDIPGKSPEAVQKVLESLDTKITSVSEIYLLKPAASAKPDERSQEEIEREEERRRLSDRIEAATSRPTFSTESTTPSDQPVIPEQPVTPEQPDQPVVPEPEPEQPEEEAPTESRKRFGRRS